MYERSSSSAFFPNTERAVGDSVNDDVSARDWIDWAVKASVDDVSVATTTQTAKRPVERVLREIIFLCWWVIVSMFLQCCFVLWPVHGKPPAISRQHGER